MKKTFKTAIALILAVLMAMGSMTAFAADSNGTISWQLYEGEKTEFIYAGNLNEGKNTVKNPDANDFYFVFEAEKTGYYLFDFSWNQIGQIRVPEKVENSECSGKKEGTYLYFYLEGIDRDYILYYFEAGSQIICADRKSADYKETDICIEYAGAEITGLDFEGGVKFDLVPDYNISERNYEDNIYTYYFTPGKTKIAFDSGKVYDVFLYDFAFESETEVTEGEYDITIEFMDKTFDKTISVYGITHTVKSIEVNNFENYDTVTEYFDGCLGYDLTDLEITVEFADGKKETIETGGTGMMGIDLQNGNPAYIYLDYGYHTGDDGNVYFSLELADNEYINLPVEKKEATDAENAKHMAEENIDSVASRINMLKWHFEDIFTAGSLEDKMVSFRIFITYLFEMVPNIMTEVFGRLNQMLVF